MNVDILSHRQLKTVSYLDIILGGIGFVLDMFGIGVLLGGRVSITEMASQGAGPVITGMVLVLAGLMLVTGYVLIEADMDTYSRFAGWGLMLIGGLFIVDMASTSFIAATDLPTAILWFGVGMSVIGELALIYGGAQLRRLL